MLTDVTIPSEFAAMGLTPTLLAFVPNGTNILLAYDNNKISKYELSQQLYAAAKNFPMAAAYAPKIQNVTD